MLNHRLHFYPPQEAQRQMRILLDMGTETPGSPAEAQLTRLMPMFVKVFRCE